jgi:hypothetical protein
VENLTKDARIQTVAELMGSLEEEITMIKAGQLKAAEGNVIMRGRGMQIKGVELFLAACRLKPQMQVSIVDLFSVQPQLPAPKPEGRRKVKKIA